MKKRIVIALAATCVLSVHAQEMPKPYQGVLDTLGKRGDYKANVLKVNIPRSDLTVTVDGVATPTPFGFGGWLAMTKGEGARDVMMGDLVLLEDEVNPSHSEPASLCPGPDPERAFAPQTSASRNRAWSNTRGGMLQPPA